LKKLSYLIDSLPAESLNVLEFCCIPDLLSVVSDGSDCPQIRVLLAVAGVLVDLLHLLQFLADHVVGGEGMAAQGEFGLATGDFWKLTHLLFLWDWSEDGSFGDGGRGLHCSFIVALHFFSVI